MWFALRCATPAATPCSEPSNRKWARMSGEPEDERRLRLDDYLPYRLSVASNAVSGLIARAHQTRFDISIPQWRLVCVLAEDPGLTQAQIVARHMIDNV